MRNRRDVLNRADIEAGGGQSTHRRLASRTRTAHPHVHTAHAVIARLVGGVGGSLLRRKRRTLARSAEAQRTRTLPRHRIAVRIGDGDDGVVEGSLNMHQPVGDVLALLLLELLPLLPFLSAAAEPAALAMDYVFPAAFFLFATVPLRGPLRVRALVWVRCPRTGRLRR